MLTLLLLLFPGLGIYGVMLANILFSAVICVLNSMSIRKFLGHKNEWKKTYLQPAIASAGMGLLAAGVYYGPFRPDPPALYRFDDRCAAGGGRLPDSLCGGDRYRGRGNEEIPHGRKSG